MACAWLGELLALTWDDIDFHTGILTRARVDYKNFHVLRHTFATRALECGTDIKTLSELMGHKSPVITMNRYVHSLMETKRKAMNTLAKTLAFGKLN